MPVEQIKNSEFSKNFPIWKMNFEGIVGLVVISNYGHKWGHFKLATGYPVPGESITIWNLTDYYFSISWTSEFIVNWKAWKTAY